MHGNPCRSWTNGISCCGYHAPDIGRGQHAGQTRRVSPLPEEGRHGVGTSTHVVGVADGGWEPSKDAEEGLESWNYLAFCESAILTSVAPQPIVIADGTLRETLQHLGRGSGIRTADICETARGGQHQARGA